MGRLQNLIKEGFMLGKNELILSFFVMIYLVIFRFVLSLPIKEEYIFFLQMVFILAENYVTISVYHNLKDNLLGNTVDLGKSFKRGAHFFGRILFYKALAGIFALLILGFAYSMIGYFKNSTSTLSFVAMLATIIWLLFPVYLLILTLLAPLIIVIEDVPLIESIIKSSRFLKKKFFKAVILFLAVLPLWLVVFFLLKLYNDISFIFQLFLLSLVSLLEIITIKIWILFYCKTVNNPLWKTC